MLVLKIKINYFNVFLKNKNTFKKHGEAKQVFYEK
jgi:hypothetical protein